MGSYTALLLVWACHLKQESLTASVPSYRCRLEDRVYRRLPDPIVSGVQLGQEAETGPSLSETDPLITAHLPSKSTEARPQGKVQLIFWRVSLFCKWTEKVFCPHQRDLCWSRMSCPKTWDMWLNHGWHTSNQAEDKDSGLWNPYPFSTLEFLFFPTSSSWVIKLPTVPLFAPINRLVRDISCPQIPPNHERLYLDIILLNKTVYSSSLLLVDEVIGEKNSPIIIFSIFPLLFIFNIPLLPP